MIPSSGLHRQRGPRGSEIRRRKRFPSSHFASPPLVPCDKVIHREAPCTVRRWQRQLIQKTHSVSALYVSYCAWFWQTFAPYVAKQVAPVTLAFKYNLTREVLWVTWYLSSREQKTNEKHSAILKCFLILSSSKDKYYNCCYSEDENQA